MDDNSTDTSSLRNLRKDDNYYLSGGDLHLLVHKVLFRVHRYFFERESSAFTRILAQTDQGSSDSTAIKLYNVTPVEFATFLWVFYNPKYSYDATVDNWHCILRLAHLWGFPEVKNLAVRELQKLDLDTVDRIVLYRQYSIDEEVLVPLYSDLCSRDEPITRQEAVKLGVKSILHILDARETLRARLMGRQLDVLPTVQDSLASSLPESSGSTSPGGCMTDDETEGRNGQARKKIGDATEDDWTVIGWPQPMMSTRAF